MQTEQPPREIKEIGRHLKVLYLGHIISKGDPWKELSGMFTVGKMIDVEDSIKRRWSEYDESVGL